MSYWPISYRPAELLVRSWVNWSSPAMDDPRRKSLRRYNSDLRAGVIVNNFLPDLHCDAGGFLTEVEYTTITSKSCNVSQVDELVTILLTKENGDFDSFCRVLEKSGHRSWSEKLNHSASMQAVKLQGCGHHCHHVGWNKWTLLLLNDIHSPNGCSYNYISLCIGVCCYCCLPNIYCRCFWWCSMRCALSSHSFNKERLPESQGCVL